MGGEEEKKQGNQGCSRLHWSEVSSCQGSARVQSNERLVHCHMSLLFLCGRHHSWEVGWAFNISIYPQSSCAPESSNQQTPASTMIPPTSSCDLLWPKPSPPLSMPSAETAIGFVLVFWFFCFFELFSRSSRRPPTNTPPGKWSHHSQHGSDQPLVTFPPTRTPFFIYATKEVPPASSKKVTVVFCLFVWLVVSGGVKSFTLVKRLLTIKAILGPVTILLKVPDKESLIFFFYMFLEVTFLSEQKQSLWWM